MGSDSFCVGKNPTASNVSQVSNWSVFHLFNLRVNQTSWQHVQTLDSIGFSFWLENFFEDLRCLVGLLSSLHGLCVGSARLHSTPKGYEVNQTDLQIQSQSVTQLVFQRTTTTTRRIIFFYVWRSQGSDGEISCEFSSVLTWLKLFLNNTKECP